VASRIGRLLALAIATLLPGVASAQIDWRGEVETHVGVKLRRCVESGGEPCPLLDYRNINRASLGADAQVGDGVAARVRLEVRNRNAPTIDEVDQHGDVSRVQPVTLRMPEAWVEGYDVLLPGLDLRVGSQRIPWGTADGWSPSDRLNPYDLEDPTQFDRRLPVPALLASYHLGSVTVSVAWMPVFVPALLPTDEFDLTENVGDPDELVDLGDYVGGDTPTVNEVETQVRLPRRTLTESAVAVRVAWESPFGDLALGAYRGRDSLPQVSGRVVPTGWSGSDEIDIHAELAYPRIQTVSAELRGPLFGDVSGWAETVAVFPSRTRALVPRSFLDDLLSLGLIDSSPSEDVTAETQSGDPYVTGVAGADVTLPGDVYVNAQYLHGFFGERSRKDLHHYALAALRYPSTGGKLRLQLRGGVEVGDGLEELGWLALARVTWLHADALRSSLLVTWQDGPDATTLGRFSELSEARVSFGAEF